MELITGENDKGRRLDRVLRKALPDHSLPLLHRLLRQKKVLINGVPAKAQDRLGSGDKITVLTLKDEKTAKNPDLHRPDKENLDILWQDCGLIAVNKPCGIAVHGDGSLDTMVRSFLADKLPPSLSFVPGPLHRLDKPSSGAVVFSASLEGARLFSSLLREQKVKKTYLAIVDGIVKKEEIWEDGLFRDKELKKTFVAKTDGGKNAITIIKPLATAEKEKRGYSLITAEIVTGRTHQIRAQAASHGYPLSGDKKYLPDRSAARSSGFFLHAWKLEFLEHCIIAPLPNEFKTKIKTIFGDIKLIN